MSELYYPCATKCLFLKILSKDMENRCPDLNDYPAIHQLV